VRLAGHCSPEFARRCVGRRTQQKSCAPDWTRQRNQKPAAFFTPALAEKIAIGNFEDDLARCSEADWIIEAVAENLEIKAEIAGARSPVSQTGSHRNYQHFRLARALNRRGYERRVSAALGGTHFFNPPRYLKLVEVIPGPKTSADVVESLSEFCDRRLGKGVVLAKEYGQTFIANTHPERFQC